MALDKTAISDVTLTVEGAIESVEIALDRINDCGLDDYELEEAKGYLRKSLQLLDRAYDIVDFAEESED